MILQLAGQDATEEFDPIHPSGTLDELKPEAKLGTVDPKTLVAKKPEAPAQKDDDAPAPLETLLNLDEIEAEATKRIPKKGWA